MLLWSGFPLRVDTGVLQQHVVHVTKHTRDFDQQFVRLICSFISRTGWLELAEYFCLSSDLLPTCRRWGEESEPTQESAKSGGDGYSTSEDAESSINGTPLSVNASQSNAATPEHEEFASSESSNPSRNVGAELTCATKYAKCPFSFKSFVNTVTSRFFVKS